MRLIPARTFTVSIHGEILKLARQRQQECQDKRPEHLGIIDWSA
jgi:hypothetical protein